jgi:PAS domain-containing protein
VNVFVRPPALWIALVAAALVTVAAAISVPGPGPTATVLFLGGLAGAALLLAVRTVAAARVATARAVEDRERSDHALRESEQRLRLTLDNALDAVVVIDREGRIVGGHGDTIIPSAYHEAHRKGLARYLATGEGPALNGRIELIARRRDGREVPVELAITPLATSDGLLFSAFVRDLSDRKAANAIKFTPDGGRVDIRVRGGPCGTFRLEVEDTGLGLALTKRIVEAQGGQVGVESVPGRGRVFVAVLPRTAG